MAFLAVLVNHVRQRPFVHVAEGVGGRGTGRRVHPHVERIVLPKTETTTWSVELHRGDSQVREHAVYPCHAALVEHGVETSIVCVHDLDAIPKGAERVPRRRDRGG